MALLVAMCCVSGRNLGICF